MLQEAITGHHIVLTKSILSMLAYAELTHAAMWINTFYKLYASD